MRALPPLASDDAPASAIPLLWPWQDEEVFESALGILEQMWEDCRPPEEEEEDDEEEEEEQEEEEEGGAEEVAVAAGADAGAEAAPQANGHVE